MQTGEGMLTETPVSDNSPVSAFIFSTATLSDILLATNKITNITLAAPVLAAIKIRILRSKSI